MTTAKRTLNRTSRKSCAITYFNGGTVANSGYKRIRGGGL